MDIVQIVITVSLLAVTTIIVITGIYFIKLIKEVHQTVSKTNLILDDAHSITSSVSKPLNSISEFVMGFKNGLSVFNKFFDKHKKDE